MSYQFSCVSLLCIVLMMSHEHMMRNNNYVNVCVVLCCVVSVEGEYVPMEGDEVTYKICAIPPKNMKVQAVEVTITHLNPGSKHETWSGQIISS